MWRSGKPPAQSRVRPPEWGFCLALAPPLIGMSIHHDAVLLLAKW
jgi:hypothetical protein